MNKIPVLKIRDENGNLIPINAIRGEKGKSAYEQAKEGGYNGTEEEFIAILNSLANTDNVDNAHYIDFKNPHKVTALQTGAIPEVCDASDDLNTQLQQGGNKMTVCRYHSETLNTPYSEDATGYTEGIVITNANSSQYGTQVCIPYGENIIYVRTLNKEGISEWVRMAREEDIVNHTNGIGGGAVGYEAFTGDGGAVGLGAASESGGAVGYDAWAGRGFAGGEGARTINVNDETIDAIQLGTGTNGNEKTLQVYDYQLLTSNGEIPIERTATLKRLLQKLCDLGTLSESDYIEVAGGMYLD